MVKSISDKHNFTYTAPFRLSFLTFFSFFICENLRIIQSASVDYSRDRIRSRWVEPDHRIRYDPPKLVRIMD